MNGHSISTTYPWSQMRRLCQAVTRQARAGGALPIAGHAVELMDMRPYRATPGWRIGRHAHSYYEAHLFLDGTAMAHEPLRQALTPGTTVYHMPNAPHLWEAGADESLRMVLWFRMADPVNLPIPSAWPVRPDLVTLLELLLADVKEAAPGWEARTRHWLRLLLGKVMALPYKGAAGAGKMEDEPDSHAVALVDQFLRDNLARRITMGDVASHLGMSVSSIAHKYAGKTGSTIMDHLDELRLHAAAVLLVETDGTLPAIGAEVGIPDPSYLCRRFRLRYGMTPTEYRQSNTADRVMSAQGGEPVVKGRR